VKVNNAFSSDSSVTAFVQTIGVTGAERSNGTKVTVGNVEVSTLTGDGTNPTVWNSALAREIAKSLRDSGLYSNAVIDVRENTVIVIQPGVTGPFIALDSNQGQNTSVGLTVNAPSGVYNGVAYGRNPWSDFLSEPYLAASLLPLKVFTFGFTGAERSDGSAVVAAGVQFETPTANDSNSAFWNNELARAHAEAMGKTTPYNNFITGHSGNTSILVAPSDFESNLPTTFSGANSNIGVSINFPSGTRDGVSLGTNPWSSFYEDRPVGAVTPSPGYLLQAAASSVNEGSTASFTLSTSNVVAGTALSYVISGVQSADIVGGQLAGSVTVDAQGRATISIPIAADNLTEGPETMTVTVRSPQGANVASANVTINDTSNSRATGSPIPENFVSYGDRFIGFTPEGSWQEAQSFAKTIGGDLVTIRSKQDNDWIFETFGDGYWIGLNDLDGDGTYTWASGFRGSDFSNWAPGQPSLPTSLELGGWLWGGLGGKWDNAPNDYKLRGLMEISVSGSISPANYAVRADLSSVNEGSTASFTLSTSNVAAGTTLSYVISGVHVGDIVGSQLSGSVNVGSNGQATISIPIAADNLTEGPETMTVTVRSPQGANVASANVTINDTSTTRAPETTLRAPAGQSKIAFSQPVSSAVISQDSSGSWTVTLPGGTSNRLEGYKRVEFADKTVALDTEAVGGQAYRVYKAAFNREPDQGGLGYWIAQMDSGMNMVEVAARFIDSNEFRSIYGNNPSDAVFLTRVYQNVLGREPEPAGYNWWLNELRTNPEKTRAKVLADFSESAENKAGVSSLISAGVVFQPYTSKEYRVVSRAAEVNEGQTAVFDVSTVNVAAGTQLAYTITGVSAADIVGGQLSGTINVGSNGKATISIPIAADNLTEGRETLQVNLQGQSASVVINDTSVTLVGIVDPGGVDPGGGGGGGGGGG